jgi:hypothetical protein
MAKKLHINNMPVSSIDGARQKGDKVDRIDWNRRNIFVLILWISLIGTVIAPLTAEATAKEAEEAADFQVLESPVHRPPKSKSIIFDSFTVAIVGISLGSMGLISRLHFHHTQLREYETEITALDAFMTKNTAIEVKIHYHNEPEPMAHGLQSLDMESASIIQEIEKRRDNLIKKISTISTEIMHMWG